MRETILLSKEYINKEEVLKKLEELGKDHEYVIETKDTYNLNDIDLYKNTNYEELIGFWVINEDEFYEDPYQINNENYYIAIYITHDSELLSDLNVLLKEIMTMYPELYVTDEIYDEFYNIEDINSGNVAAWLKE